MSDAAARLDHRDRDRHGRSAPASTPSGRACATRRSPVKRIDRFDPSPFRSQVAAQVDDFDPLAWMPPKTARQLDRFSQFGMVAGRLALDDARLTPGADGAARARTGSASTSARRSVASPTPRSSTSATSRRASARSRPNLALAVFGGAAPANLGIALDVRGPILSTANSCASGAVALGEALGDLREGRVDAAIAGGCEIPLSPLAFGAFDIIRALSARSQRRPGARRRGRSTPGATGSSWARAPRCSCSRTPDVAERRGATPYAELLGYGATSDAYHMVQPRADGREAARAATIALDDARRRPGRDRLRQRPRVVDAARRRGRGAGHRGRAR